MFSDHGYAILHTLYATDEEFKDDDTTKQISFPIAGDEVGLDKEGFSFCALTVSIHPNGSDTWIYQPSIELGFSDGTSNTYLPTYAQVYSLNQLANSVHAEFKNTSDAAITVHPNRTLDDGFDPIIRRPGQPYTGIGARQQRP